MHARIFRPWRAGAPQIIAPQLVMLDGPDCPENVTGAAALLHFFTPDMSRKSMAVRWAETASARRR
jgi:hypothetical protein